uniref:Uncharacterized protein n=1 Tax=Triticum urartu TaxID=4572 RepID=A0A8R7UFG8_TRIUA
MMHHALNGTIRLGACAHTGVGGMVSSCGEGIRRGGHQVDKWMAHVYIAVEGLYLTFYFYPNTRLKW